MLSRMQFSSLQVGIEYINNSRVWSYQILYYVWVTNVYGDLNKYLYSICYIRIIGIMPSEDNHDRQLLLPITTPRNKQSDDDNSNDGSSKNYSIKMLVLFLLCFQNAGHALMARYSQGVLKEKYSSSGKSYVSTYFVVFLCYNMRVW